MLKQIADYASRGEGIVRPGFAEKAVRWLIDLKPNGTVFVQVLGVDSKGRSFSACPVYPANEMQSGGKAHPLVETLNVVTLLTKTDDEPITPKEEAKHGFFVQSLRDLAEYVPNAALVADALERPDVLVTVRTALREAKAKVTEKATLAYDGHVLVEDPGVVEWWTARRKASDAEAGSGVPCLVTGELIEPLPTHPKIGGLGAVGGLAIGSSLISFDKGAFASYGLEQSANAPVSEEAATLYSTGLNRIIREGKRLVSMIVGYWYSGPVSPESDLIASFFEGEGEDDAEAAGAKIQARKLLHAIESGERADLRGYRYYVLVVSGAAGRVMVREWREDSFEALARAVASWFDALSITASHGQSLIRGPKIFALLASTARESSEVSPPLEASLWQAALTGGAIPLAAVRGALNRTRIDILEDQVRPIRMALLKAFIVRNTRNGNLMQPYLNEDHPEVAYHAGRVLAIMADIQFLALGDVKANLIQRFYPAACATPALVFGRLVRQSQFHLRKIEGGLSYHLDGKLAGVWGRVMHDLPATFDLTEQSLFALGYYQQIAHDRAERAERKASQVAHQTTASSTAP